VEFMLLFMERKDAPKGDPAGFAAMKRFSAELARQGKLRRGAPLAAESAGVRVRVHNGEALVTDGPFAESKEVVAGFSIIDVAGRDEAVEIARRVPHARHGTVEVHAVRWRESVADPGNGTPFLMIFGLEPGPGDPDGTKLREMMSFGEALKREGRFLETAPLAGAPPPARIEPRGDKPLVIDGPFAEAKEAVGGYGLVRVGSRAEAIELAKRYPHAKWGPVEVREVLFFDPV
jgi:hypothetical protein